MRPDTSHKTVGDMQFERNKDRLLATALEAIRDLKPDSPASELERVLQRRVGHLQPLTAIDLATL